MKTSWVKAGLYCLVAAALTIAPLAITAQELQPNADKQETKSTRPKPSVTPFHGKLKSVDKEARTIKFGSTTIHLNDETRISKDGKTAKIEDAVVGEPVGGAYKKTEDGKLVATMVRFGAKQEVTKEAKKSKTEE